MKHLSYVLTFIFTINLTFSNLFFSEADEGSSNHKYLEVYNASDMDIDLSAYSLST